MFTTVRVFACVVLAAVCSATAAGQQPPPAAPAGVVPPDQNLPPHIRKLTGFGERAEFSLDSKRVLFLSKTFGDAMEIDLATGVIRNLTAHFPHFGFTRALYLANGHILLSGPDRVQSRQRRCGADQLLAVRARSRRQRPPSASRRQGGGRAGALPQEDAHRVVVSGGAVPGGRHAAGIVADARSRHRVREGSAEARQSAEDPRQSRRPLQATLEPQNYRPPQERELIFSAYDYQQGEVFGIDLTTGKLTNYSNGPGVYDEPEGIFPSGEFTTVESDKHNPAGQGFDRADIHKLKLDGSGAMERLTFFADVPTYRSSNPVVSDDGRYMAFQMGRSGVAAGIGYGLFLYDFGKAPANPGR